MVVGSGEGTAGGVRRNKRAKSTRLRALCALLAGIVPLSLMGPATAYNFDHLLRRGSRGRDVKALELRVAGWLPGSARRHVVIDRRFGARTAGAVKGFQRRHGLAVDGIAGPQTFRSLRRLDNRNGSTAHFNFSELDQERNRACPRKANKRAGTFKGGRLPARRIRYNVRKLMWRLEALRNKSRGHPIKIVSGFRSVAYNRCIGGARVSQHLFGTAADILVSTVPARRERRLAKRSHWQGICVLFVRLPQPLGSARREQGLARLQAVVVAPARPMGP